MITLILGGARSGKSAHAERLAVESGRAVVYVATAQAQDDEMRERIAHHRARRPSTWRTVEEPLQLARALRDNDAPGRVLIVDCLTLWLSNLLHAGAGDTLSAERDALLACLPALQADVVLVSNEVGTGVIPLGALTRTFVDESGWLHQSVAAASDKVIWMVAGCAIVAKGG